MSFIYLTRSKTLINMIKIKRIYEHPHKSDGFRVLVDRLWPRGISKENAHLDEWAKELSPSPTLRKWFNHTPEKWEEFKLKYLTELKHNNEVEVFLNNHKNKKNITLLYGAKDTKHTHALVLQYFLKIKLKHIQTDNSFA